MFSIRNAQPFDLDFLVHLEKLCFQDNRRFSRSSLRNSILSLSQEVYVVENENNKIGASIVQFYKKTLRIYSIAVDPNYQGKSVGKMMLEHILNTARSKGYSRVSLEADLNNDKLISWYKHFGFSISTRLKDYYDEGEDAYRMNLFLESSPEKTPYTKKKNIVVVDYEIKWLRNIDSIELIMADTFIKNEKYHSSSGFRIFNLCSSYGYQSIGYYVSLLASARDQRVIPNVMTIKDFSEMQVVKSIGEEIYELIQKSLKFIKEDNFILKVYFGKSIDVKYNKLAKSLYNLFEAPFLEFRFEKTRDWILRNVTPIAISDIDYEPNILEYALEYFNRKRFSYSCFKDYKYDLAILVDNNELHPPSCKTALNKFKQAAEKVGFYVDFIGKDDYKRISEYDALFIRTTTDVNDYTYQFSRYAYAEGLIVIDDPWSILRCSNKMYLSERMKKGGILTPKSWVISKNMIDELEINKLRYPLILKKPDSAFSLGVYKVKDREEFDRILGLLFESSELVIAQEYIESDYDWRIGVLDNRPIFASKYYMAKGHWQIYNWASDKEDETSGDDECIPIEDVPQEVLNTATKAASYMGDGLYGVDLKEVDGKVYLIEVNDNPNIDFGVEDKILGDDLYLKIMESIFNRIENSRNIKRFISN